MRLRPIACILTVSVLLALTYSQAQIMVSPISQNAVAGLTTSDSPTFSGINIVSGAAYKYNGLNLAIAQTDLNNLYLGDAAGNLTATGSANIGVGPGVMPSVTTGADNVGVGFNALHSLTGGVGGGANNVAVGSQALASNTTAFDNTAIGYSSLYNTTTGTENTAIGYLSGTENVTGEFNVAFGFEALRFNVSSDFNVAVGHEALKANTAADNTAVGAGALRFNVSGIENTAIGKFSLYSDLANYNTAVGLQSLENNTTGAYNTSVGWDSSLSNTTGSYNSIFGSQAGQNLSGNFNTIIGQIAGYNGTNISGSVFLGYGAGFYETASNTFYVDNQVRADAASGRAGALLYGTFNATPANQTLAINAVLTPTFGIVGKTDASNATAGNVGEYVSSFIASARAVSLTTATAANVTSIILTAGDWDVEGNVNIAGTSATYTQGVGGISTTTATLPTDGSEVNSGAQFTALTITDGLTCPRKRINVLTTTTVYLVAKATFSAGTMTAYGGITARRVMK